MAITKHVHARTPAANESPTLSIHATTFREKIHSVQVREMHLLLHVRLSGSVSGFFRQQTEKAKKRVHTPSHKSHKLPNPGDCL